jgi:hypothetical protein
VKYDGWKRRRSHTSDGTTDESERIRVGDFGLKDNSRLGWGVGLGYMLVPIVCPLTLN